MKSLIGSFIGLVLSGQRRRGAHGSLKVGCGCRLDSQRPCVQVRLFDLTDLRRFVGTTTESRLDFFALSLQTLSGGTALPTDFALGQNYPNPFRSCH